MISGYESWQAGEAVFPGKEDFGAPFGSLEIAAVNLHLTELMFNGSWLKLSFILSYRAAEIGGQSGIN